MPLSLRLIVMAAVGTAVLAAGCEKKSNQQQRVKVSGKVTLDGKPVTTGSVSFDPADGSPPMSFDILDGKYEGRAAVGKCKVRINATRKINMREKMKMDGPGYDQPVEENMIPARYNSASEITREVVDGTENEFNFELKSS